jgi:hypothetical protein
MKQGRGDDYIPVFVTSSNSGWHKGRLYLWNNLEFAFPRTPRTPSRSREETSGRPGEDGVGEDHQGSLGGAVTSPRSWGHPGGSARAIPRPRSRAAPEATASSLRDDGRPGPLDGDRDRTIPPVATQGSAPCGAGDREVDLLMVAVAAAPDAPQRGDKKFVSYYLLDASRVFLL